MVLAWLRRVLLRDYPSQINAIFFGLVAGSCLVVVRGIGGWTKLRVALMAVAMVSAFVVVGFPTDSLEPSGDPMTLFAIGSIAICAMILPGVSGALDRKSTRLNSSHKPISYAVFCLKKKTNKTCKDH